MGYDLFLNSNIMSNYVNTLLTMSDVFYIYRDTDSEISEKIYTSSCINKSFISLDIGRPTANGGYLVI